MPERGQQVKAHIGKAQAQLGDLAALKSKTDQAEKNILDLAEKKLAGIQKQLNKMQGVEFSSEDLQDSYNNLIAERGQLQLVISKAHIAMSS